MDIALDEAPANRFADPATSSAAPAELAPQAGKQRPELRSEPRMATPVAQAAAPPPPEEAIMAARSAAEQAASLEALRAIMSAFEGCALRTTAKQLVFGDGSAEARLMFVGEAPGLRRGSDRRSVRRQVRAIARQDAGRDRGRPVRCLHRQCRAMAAAGEPRPLDSRDADLPALHQRQIELVGSRSAGLPRQARNRHAAWRTTASSARADAGSRTRPRPAISAPCRCSTPPICCAMPIEKRFAWRDFLAIKKALAS